MKFLSSVKHKRRRRVLRSRCMFSISFFHVDSENTEIKLIRDESLCDSRCWMQLQVLSDRGFDPLDVRRRSSVHCRSAFRRATSHRTPAHYSIEQPTAVVVADQWTTRVALCTHTVHNKKDRYLHALLYVQKLLKRWTVYCTLCCYVKGPNKILWAYRAPQSRNYRHWLLDPYKIL